MRLFGTLLLAVAFAAPPLAGEAGPMRPSATWDEIRGDIVEGELRDGDALYGIEAPFRAEDAATVPVRITQAAGAPDVRRLILVVDENPAPVAAEFSFGDAMAPLDLELRVRVDAYSNVRAIVEAADGARYMAGRFVRASGGCSAPAAKDAAAALAELGRMKVRWLDDAPDGRQRAQVMLRHPNYSGLQRDQVTQLFVPANFVHELEVRQGGELLFRVEGGISISEDPAFRFAYTGSDAPLEVRAADTDGREFTGTFPAGM